MTGVRDACWIARIRKGNPYAPSAIATVISPERNQQTKDVAPVRTLRCHLWSGIKCHILFNQRTERLPEFDPGYLARRTDSRSGLQEASNQSRTASQREEQIYNHQKPKIEWFFIPLDRATFPPSIRKDSRKKRSNHYKKKV